MAHWSRETILINEAWSCLFQQDRYSGARQVLAIVPRQVKRNSMNENSKVFNPTSHPDSMTIGIVHGTEGMKPTAVTIDYLRGFDIILTTPDTIRAQIRAYKTTLEALSRGVSAKVPSIGFCLVGVEPPKVNSENDYVYTKELKPVTSWQMIM